MHRRSRVLGSLVIVLASGCTLDPATIGMDSASSSDSTAGTTTSGGMLGSGGVGGQTEASSELDDGASFLMDPSTSGGASESCDPLVQDCEELEACYPEGEVFGCLERRGTGRTGEPCVDHPQCDRYYFCDGDETCEALCLADDPQSCVFPAQQCEAWFPEGGPTGLEHVGACRDTPLGVVDCDPLLQDCALGSVCEPNPAGSGCVPEGSGGLDESCDAGCIFPLACVRGSCRELCSFPSDGCSVPGQACLPYFPPNGEPEALLGVGFCSVR